MSKDIVTLEDVGSNVLLESSAEKYSAIESQLDDVIMNLTGTADQVKAQIPTLIALAEASQQPKVYEALAKLLAAYSTLNKDAANVAKQKQDLYDSFRQKKEAPKQEATTIINEDNRTIAFNGTSTDMLDEYLKTKNKK